MDTHGSKPNRCSQGKLDPDTMEELRQLAELAKRDPKIMQQITARRQAEAGLRILSLTTDELEELEKLSKD
jgi:hypothetical protein